eukprot:11715351-Karenia_brevis.AAC.1
MIAATNQLVKEQIGCSFKAACNKRYSRESWGSLRPDLSTYPLIIRVIFATVPLWHKWSGIVPH